MHPSHKLFATIILSLATFISGCEKESADAVVTKTKAGSTQPLVQKMVRWYPAERVLHGARLYQKHCQSCHGVNATGSSREWHLPMPNGRYPPPPLNGSAHSWHHPLPWLLNTIDAGSVHQGGEMPAFGNTLSIDEILSVIAYFQQFWPQEIYVSWAQNFPDQFKRSP